MIGSRKKQPVNQRRAAQVPLRERLGSLRERSRAWWQGLGSERPPEPDSDEVEVEAESDDNGDGGWWSWVIWGTAALCLGIVGLGMLNLRDFQTRIETGVASKFEVAGSKRVSQQQVLGASGVRWGTPLTAIDRDTVSRAIEKLPWVRQAEVEAELPNKVSFHVTEYVPYALLLGHDKMMIVDKDGFVFKEAELGEAGDLPVITGFSPTVTRDAHARLPTTEPTTDQVAERRRLRTVLRLIEAHGQSQLVERFPLSEVHWDPVLGITLVSARDGAELRLGLALGSDPNRALAVAARVLAQADHSGEWLRYALLDDELRPDRVVVRTQAPGTMAGGAGAAALPKSPTADKKDADQPAADGDTQPD
jgi:hypothetical protein